MVPMCSKHFHWWLCLVLVTGLLIDPLAGSGDSRAAPSRAKETVYRGVQLPASLSTSERKVIRLALDALHGNKDLFLQQRRRWRHDIKGLTLMAKPFWSKSAVSVFFSTDRKRALHDLIVVDLARGPKGLTPVGVYLHQVLTQLEDITVTRSGMAYQLLNFTIVARGNNIVEGNVPLTDLSHAGRPPNHGCSFFEGRTKRRLGTTEFVKRTMWRALCVKGGQITLGDEQLPLPSPSPDPPSYGMGPDREDY